MDVEFHYYINYIVALRAGFHHETAKKIAHSAQYVDDNTEGYTVLKKTSLEQYNNIVTQSVNPMLGVKDIVSIFPVFHFIPGNEIMKSSSLRRDGSCRYMTTTPNNKLARNCIAAALKSNDPYWMGIASHSFVDTWAHQNFTGLKDVYNCVEKHQTNKSGIGAKLLGLSPHLGHLDVFHLPDVPGTVWYDYRLKDMKVDNNSRFLEAAKALFEIYIKYTERSLLPNRPKDPHKAWNELEKILEAIFMNDFETLQKNLPGCDDLYRGSSFLMMKILGLNRSNRIEFYCQLAEKLEKSLGITNSQFCKYDKNKWLNGAIYETSESLELYEFAANDNTGVRESCYASALCDSGKSNYFAGSDSFGEQIKRKISTLLGLYKKLHFWRCNDYKTHDWYLFQEAAKKQHSFLINKVFRIMKKDLVAMKRENLIP